MRTYGRTYDQNGKPTWVVVTTDTNGYNDNVYLTTLLQVLQLNLQESPFWANYGLPDQQSVLQQIAPDFYVAITQQQFSQYFASLSIARSISADGITPTYLVSCVFQSGAILVTEVPQ